MRLWRWHHLSYSLIRSNFKKLALQLRAKGNPSQITGFCELSDRKPKSQVNAAVWFMDTTEYLPKIRSPTNDIFGVDDDLWL